MATSTERSYKLGTTLQQIEGGTAKHIVFIVTQACNLACKYCYLTHKNIKGQMTFDVARRAVDFFLSQEFSSSHVVWDFAGGEPLLEIDLIDRICDYIKLRTCELDHPWKDHYRFMVGTNGLLYSDPKFQSFITKNREHLNIAMTIDGTRAKHDLNRVYGDGRGSYRDVLRNVKLWMKEFPGETTKVTFASQDLPLLKESILHLWRLGLKNIPANLVFEDVWKEGDEKIFEEQLRSLADHVIKYRLWDKYACSLFHEELGLPMDPEVKRTNYCGAGLTFAVDYQGIIYPCQRFMEYSLENKKPYSVGSIETGIDQDKVRPLVALDLPTQSPSECVDCEVASGCAWCTGLNYDSAPVPTFFQRATYICKMHKARARGNEYYWGRLRRATGVRRPDEYADRRRRHLVIMASDNAVCHCSYSHEETRGPETLIDGNDLQQGLAYAYENFFRPMVLQPVHGSRLVLPGHWDPINIVSARSREKSPDDIIVYDNGASPAVQCQNSILIVNSDNVNCLSTLVHELWQSTARVNLVLRDSTNMDDSQLAEYEQQLHTVGRELVTHFMKPPARELSVLSDRMFLQKPEDCGAGVRLLTLAPNGLFYLCPAFYRTHPEQPIGSPLEGVDHSVVDLCDRKRAPLCADCQAFHCRRCVFESSERTLHYNVPSRGQCVVAHVELRVAAAVRDELASQGLAVPAPVINLGSLDPMETRPHWSMAFGRRTGR